MSPPPRQLMMLFSWQGTRTLSFFNADCSCESVFLLAIKEVPVNDGIHKKEYGVCFVDTCVGTFHVRFSFSFNSIFIINVIIVRTVQR